MAAFSRTLDQYQDAANHELVADKKALAQARIDGFRAQLKQARDTFGDLQQKRAAAAAAELFQGRTGANEHMVNRRNRPDFGASSENPYRSPGPFADNNDPFAHHQKEQDMLSRADSQIDEFLERGRLVLQSLADQRATLTATRRRIYGVANTLGISASTIAAVEQRAAQDKRIFYLGVLVLFLGFYAILRYLG